MSGPAPLSQNTRLERLRRLAYWLDEGIRLPGTGVRIGLDPILGLVPGFGDAAGAFLAVAILVEAARLGIPRLTLTRMAFNIAFDALLGAVPLFGDVFDVVWKANRRNVALIESHAAGPAAARTADRFFVALLTGTLLVFCAAVLAGGVLLTSWLLQVAGVTLK